MTSIIHGHYYVDQEFDIHALDIEPGPYFPRFKMSPCPVTLLVNVDNSKTAC